MKILLVNKYWYPRGGAEVVAMTTAKLLREAGHEVFVFAMDHEQNTMHHELFPSKIDYRQDSLVKKIKNSVKSIRNEDAKLRFEKMLQECKPDVVHFHNIYHQLSYALLEVTKKYNIRSVMTLHDYKMICPNYSLFHHGKIDETILGKKYYRCVLTNCMESFPESILATVEAYYRQYKQYEKMIDVYISPSEFLKRLFVRAGWNENKISVVRNPAEIPVSSPQTPHAVLGPVTFIGRLSEEKGVEVLLKAAALTPHIPYAVVGTGPFEHRLRALCIYKKLQNVVFYGWKTGKELEALYNAASLFVIPSVWYENAPLSITEAKMHKKIVLGSNIGGIPELLSPEFLFPVGDEHVLAERIEYWYGISPFEREKTGHELKMEALKMNDSQTYLKKIMNLYHGKI